MNVTGIQQQLFQAVKARLQVESSMADEIAKLLNISTDSAYRRIRGEKMITLEELHAICINYRISLDQLMGINTGAIMFHGN